MASPGLAGKVALVAGATRGAGRGIAVALGEAKATVYCTGRSSAASRAILQQQERSSGTFNPMDLDCRPESIEDTSQLVTEAGGFGIPIQCDHTDEEQVKNLIERIEKQHGRLDILVNSVWGGDSLIQWDKKFWELDTDMAGTVLQRSLTSHLLTNRYAVPLILMAGGGGLVVEVVDGAGLQYRGNLIYDMIKIAQSRLAFSMAEELRPLSVAAVAVTPGFLRSEAMLEMFGVTSATWKDGARQDPNFAHSESPAFVGRAIASLAQDGDVMRFSGQSLSSWHLAEVYGFTDADGTRPDWGAHAKAEEFGVEQASSQRRYIAGFEGTDLL